MNSVHLIGNLAADPKINKTNDLVVANFTVAVTRKFTNANGEREADFIYCTAFRKTAELCESYLNKGSKVGITGHLQNNTYKDKEGKDQYKTAVVVDDITFLSPKKAESEEQAEEKTETIRSKIKTEVTKQKSKSKMAKNSDDPEDLPF